MTNTRHFPARADAPIVCDMTTAEDTADQRLAEYSRLFERALVRRHRDDDGVIFAFRADAGIREAVEDLARREAICCPFLDYGVETVGGEVTYTITNPLDGDSRASVDAALDVIYSLPEHSATDMAGLLGRLADRGLEVVTPRPARHELRGPAAT
jgi:hypothetical protein